MHQNNIPVLYAPQHFLYRRGGISRLPVQCVYVPHDDRLVNISQNRIVFIASRKSDQRGSFACHRGHGLVTAVNLAADLGCVQLIQIFMFICMVANFMAIVMHSLYLSLIRRYPAAYHKEGGPAVMLLQAVHNPVSHRRIRTIVKCQRHHRFGGIDVASSAGYHSFRRLFWLYRLLLRLACLLRLLWLLFRLACLLRLLFRLACLLRPGPRPFRLFPAVLRNRCIGRRTGRPVRISCRR